MLAFTLLGVLLRARGFLFDRHGLWVDEATWAIMLMRDPLETLLIRPVGFMALAKLFAVVLGPFEVVLRFQSFIAGMAVVLLSIPLARRLFRAPAAQLLFVAILALHPAAIDLSKEFKPYECSLLGHLLLLFLVLRYLESQRASHLVLALSSAFASNLFAQDMVMAYPGVFLVLGWDTLRRRRDRLAWVVVGASAILLLLSAQYWFIWRHLDADEASFWGQKYGVFYEPSRRQSFAGWWLTRYEDVVRFPGLRRRYWDAAWVSDKELKALRLVDGWVWLLVHVVGVLRLLAARRFRTLALLGLPLLTTTAMNYLGHWPFGAFRTNLFMVGYMAAFAGMALDAPSGRTRRWPALVPAVVLVALPLVLFDRWWHVRKKSLAYDTDLPLVLEALTNLQAPPQRGRVTLFLSRRSCDSYEFYATTHPVTSEQYRKVLGRTFSVQCFGSLPELATGIVELTPREEHAWLLTDMGQSDVKELRDAIPGVFARMRFYANPTRLFELTRAPPPAR
jgi:hypothetical protein